MEYIFNYISFLFEVATIVAAIVIVLLVLASIKSKGMQSKTKIVVKNLTDKYNDYKEELESELFNSYYLKNKAKKELDKLSKQDKKNKKKKDSGRKSTVFVLNFKGSVMADEVDQLREEISAILLVAKKDDEVVVNVESPGGAVHGYGLAASQLDRIKKAGIKLTVCVDKVAASGGYLMACVADEIVAAPFSIIGSIGVVMQIPNLNKVLKKHDVEYNQITAGEYKRTLTMFGENTEEAKQKVKEELEEIHNIFKEYILKYRPQVDLGKVATGEHWLASQAKDLDLVDSLQTSDEYIIDLIQQKKDRNILEVTCKKSEKLSKKLMKEFSLESENLLDRLINKKSNPML